MTPQTKKRDDIRLAITQQRLAGLHDGNSRVAEYESLLDLFTLISFILIFAAFIYVARSTEANQHASATISNVDENGSVSLQDLPKDTLLITLYKEDSGDILLILDGATDTKNKLTVNEKNVSSKLGDVFAKFEKTQKINFVIDDQNQDEISILAIKIERWFADNSYNPNVYFMGSKN